MSKVLEKIMYNRVISFLNKLDFFYKHQYGFRKKYSTCHATSVLAESVKDAFEKKEHVLRPVSTTSVEKSILSLFY